MCVCVCVCVCLGVCVCVLCVCVCVVAPLLVGTPKLQKKGGGGRPKPGFSKARFLKGFGAAGRFV